MDSPDQHLVGETVARQPIDPLTGHMMFQGQIPTPHVTAVTMTTGICTSLVRVLSLSHILAVSLATTLERCAQSFDGDLLIKSVNRSFCRLVPCDARLHDAI